MKRATITLSDELAVAVDNYRRDQDARPSFTAAVQAALRDYLEQRGYLNRPYRPLKITPAPQGSGFSDVSKNHDRYLAETEE